MSDIIFNELSIDFSFSNAPSSEQKALEILKKFVDNCLAYSLAAGTKIFVREYGNISGDSVNLSTTNFWQHNNIYALLSKLGEQDELKSEEILRFKQMLAEISFVDVDPEYKYKTKEVYGIGKAIESESYIVSLSTHSDWNSKDITNVQKTTVTPVYSTSTCPAVNNISTLSHVFIDHSIWNSCEYKHNKPKKDYLLPNFNQSEYIPKAYGYLGWSDFKNEMIRTLDITKVKKMAEIMAIINGYVALGAVLDNQNKRRDTYNSKNYYLQVETQHNAFEVYNGVTNHIGELELGLKAINEDKADNQRFIRL
nr:hypothetical protein [uncultured Carboxylicivirga sp.]